MGQERRGIYLLANDEVVSWAIALLESLAVHDPSLPVVVIPFDDRVDALDELRSRHPFELLDEDLRRFDDVGRTLGVPSRAWGLFRKLAAFSGPFERFVYLDTDHLVTASLEPVLDGVGENEIAFELDTSPEHVFRPGTVLDDGTRTFNAGGFAARRGALRMQQVVDTAEEAVELWPMFADLFDQSFLNVLVRRAGLSTPLFSELAPAVRFMWAGDRATLRHRDDEVLDEHGTAIGSIHWAGYPLDGAMPFRSIWLDYRFRSAPVLQRTGAVLMDPLRRMRSKARVRRRANRPTTGP